MPDTYRQGLELDLKVAQAAFDAAPDREDSYIWLGRRYGYLGRYDEAVEVFSAGLEKFPDSYKLLRFRGRHLARSRQFAAAIADYQLGLEKMRGQADSFEPNGIPNALDLTTSSYRQNLHYYLGQTSFAVGDYKAMFEQLEKSREPLVVLPFDDHEIAVIFWQTIALRKQSRHDQAKALLSRLQEPARILENATYYQALRVLTGRADESGETSGDNLARFALAMKREFAGDVDGARAVLEAILADNAKGYWPAEAALAQLSTGAR
ncbi:tetratricopeptide repeat protein [Parahaliea mediterranea]|uniref:Tetratricopeptide repeat protein n=1 Tax=Parahaliea mediterranea TaxID=651086 RepID=A0A939ILV0_9GAMM|nr:tetratricopeptide repeat protein [Parahaliea mediterranea]MBN7798766.1 tetratricopeptide repeat protein [Parahaliea mediterranea]